MECRLCGFFTWSKGDFDDHRWEHCHCTKCDRPFGDRQALTNHLIDSPAHHYCKDCYEDFSTANGLRMHIERSKGHRPANALCPFCNKPFISDSVVLKHIENRGCVIDMDRRTMVNRMVELEAAAGQRGWTIPKLKYHGKGDEELVSQQFIATERTWNGKAYDCYLCCHPFEELNLLNQHLNSGKDDPKELQCPKCHQPFRVLSGLFEHIEFGTCGVHRWRGVKTLMQRTGFQLTY